MVVGLIVVIILYSIYKRYITPCGIKEVDEESMFDQNIEVLDLRDFHHSNRLPYKGATNIPFPYLKRYYKDLKEIRICVIASDITDINLSSRFLKSKGYDVIGYYLLSEQKKSPCIIELNCH